MAGVMVIVGSSRSDGAQANAVEAVATGVDAEVVDLSGKAIGYYDYAATRPDDDFIPIAERMADADTLVFATPVYWYAMSAQLKTFFDRFTDLITVRKDIGRKLAGKRVFVLAWGNGTSLPEGFEVPFASTAEYLGMGYHGCFYYCTGRSADVEQRRREADAFRRRIVE